MISRQGPHTERDDDFNEPELEQLTEPMSSIVIASPQRAAVQQAVYEPEGVMQAPPVPPAVRTHYSPIPILAGTFFLVIQTLLLLRFVLKTLNVPNDSLPVGILYAITDVLAAPFYLLARMVPIPFLSETYTLLALLVYGLLARFLVRFLKALLNSD